MTVHYDDEIMRELVQTFQIEAADHLETLNRAILQLEQAEERDDELLQTAFRAAHSLKGAARAVGQETIQTLAHRMEDQLKAVRDDELSLSVEVCDGLYAALDAIQALLEDKTPDIAPVLAQLGQQASEESPASPTMDIPTTQPAPPAPTEGTASALPSRGEGEETMRIGVRKLDTLMAETGELVISQRNSDGHARQVRSVRQRSEQLAGLWQTARMQLKRLDDASNSFRSLVDMMDEYQQLMKRLFADIDDLDSTLQRDALRLAMVTNRLQDEMRQVRMMAFETLEGYLQRIVRDVARQDGKQVQLVVIGGAAEVDKKVLDLLKDPLLHLLRNAVGHGIEMPDERTAAGKDPAGTVTVQVKQRGSEAHIIVSDDGRGFPLEALRRGIHTDEVISEEAIISRAFLPGVTTASMITEISGRGIGLDVVRKQIELLQGRIRVETTADEGTRIQLIVPVSLAMTRALLVRAGGRQYALPLASVEKIITPEKTFYAEGRLMLRHDGQSLPVAALTDILRTGTLQKNTPFAIIAASAAQRVAILVDDIVTEQEITVKSFSPPLVKAPHLIGAALLGNGEPVAVLNLADVVQVAQETPFSVTEDAPLANDEPQIMPTILVVDDSITTRTLEKNILQAAGYTVITATDGVKALNVLKHQPVDLVVADVEMPNLDGISLTKHLRASDDYQHLPLILVTSLESADDRQRGMMAGANAYIVKRGFSQSELLTTIEHLL